MAGAAPLVGAGAIVYHRGQNFVGAAMNTGTLEHWAIGSRP